MAKQRSVKLNIFFLNFSKLNVKPVFLIRKLQYQISQKQNIGQMHNLHNLFLIKEGLHVPIIFVTCARLSNRDMEGSTPVLGTVCPVQRLRDSVIQQKLLLKVYANLTMVKFRGEKASSQIQREENEMEASFLASQIAVSVNSDKELDRIFITFFVFLRYGIVCICHLLYII